MAKLDTRSKTRNSRPRQVRAKSISRREMVVWACDDDDYPDVERPRTRGDCAKFPRPCPFVSCRYHLYLEVSSRGSIKFNFPDLQVHELAHSCALDVADEGGHKLETIGSLVNLTRERVRQVEGRALERLSQEADFSEHLDEGDNRTPVRRFHSPENRQLPGGEAIPILKALEGGELSIAEIANRAYGADDVQTTRKAGWVMSKLVLRGLVERVRRGVYRRSER